MEKVLKIVIGVLVDLRLNTRGDAETHSGERRSHVLVSRRPGNTVLPGVWEFPGGKIEPGETPEQALVREFQEELGITIVPGRALCEINHTYDHASVCLLPYLCAFPPSLTQVPENLQVAEHRWVRTAELAELTFPEANRPLIDEIMTIVH